MERMGDILARSARIGARRTRLGSAKQVDPTDAVAKRPAAPRTPSRATPAPRRALPAATPDVAQATAADTIDTERILELPARRVIPAMSAPRTAMQPTRAAEAARTPTSAGPISANGQRTPAAHAAPPRAATNRGMSAGSSGMLSLGAAAQGYVNALRPAQRPGGEQQSSASSAPRSSTTRRTASPRAANAPDVCPRCHGAGYVRLDVPVGDPNFGQAVACSCKERLLEDRRMSDLRRMSSLDAFRDKTFETFDASLPGLREAMEVARRYAEDPHGWLVLSGGYGVGKTHLAAAIAHERLANGQSVFFSIVPDLLDHLRAAFAPSSEMPYDELFDKVREAGVLVLDDLGAENATAWATEKLFQIINYRYNYRMPTVVTTNHRLLAHMDERIRSRLSDKSFVRQVSVDAADYRERHTGRTRPTRQSAAPSEPRTQRNTYSR